MKKILETVFALAVVSCVCVAKVSAKAYIGFDNSAKVLILFASDKEYYEGSKFKGYYLNKLWSGATVEDSHPNMVPWPARSCSWTKRIIIDESFKEVRPKRCAGWFMGYEQVKQIEGIENLNTSETTALDRMFLGCTSLTSIDLSTFDTGKVTKIYQMFSGCIHLKTVYVSENWNTKNTILTNEKANYMFTGCVNLVGEEGTVYTESMAGDRCDFVGKGGLLTLKK